MSHKEIKEPVIIDPQSFDFSLIAASVDQLQGCPVREQAGPGDAWLKELLASLPEGCEVILFEPADLLQPETILRTESRLNDQRQTDHLK